MSGVRVVKATHVTLPATPTPPPERVELSFFDVLWISLPPMQRILLFHGGAHLPPLPSLLDSLRSALSRALLHYFTLAGKLTYLPASGSAAIDCTPAAVLPGVAFFEAEADGIDLARLAEDEKHDLEVFRRLIPPLEVSVLPAPVFAVQVTAFAEGVAVGFAFHHAVADGRAIWGFVEAWAAECLGENPPPPLPTVDRALIKHPKSEEIGRLFLRCLAPSLPKTQHPIYSSVPPYLERRTLVVSSRRMQQRKQKTAVEPPPSTFVSIVAHAWISFVHSKSLDRTAAATADTYVIFPADCRTHLDPPILPGQQNYFGNCVKVCVARATAKDLVEGGGHARACSAMQRAVREASLEEPLADCGVAWFEWFREVDLKRSLFVAASPQFAVYDIDFGWGKPSRVETISMHHDGYLAFSKAKDEGGVQMTVALHALHIQPFVEHFVGN